MKIIIAALLSIALCACGGGGGGETGTASSSKQASSITLSTSSESSLSSSQESSSSESSSSESSNGITINPLGDGSGTFSTRFVEGGTYSINEDSGVVTQLEKSLDDSYTAADIDQNGIVVAVSSTTGNIDQIDLQTGSAKTLFTAPETLSAIAISSDGTIIAVSRDKEFSKKFIYRFNSSGDQLSKVVSEDFNPEGIDFDSEGNLIGIDLFGVWKINALTGRSTSLYLTSPSGQGDIDISSSGELRVFMFGKLEIYSLATGQSIKSTVLQQDYFSFSPLVHR